MPCTASHALHGTFHTVCEPLQQGCVSIHNIVLFDLYYMTPCQGPKAIWAVEHRGHRQNIYVLLTEYASEGQNWSTVDSMILKFCRVPFTHTQTINSMLSCAVWYFTFINAITSLFCCCNSVLKLVTLVPGTKNMAQNWAQRNEKYNVCQQVKSEGQKNFKVKYLLVSLFISIIHQQIHCLPSTLASTWTNFYNNFSKVWFMYLKNKLRQTTCLSKIA